MKLICKKCFYYTKRNIAKPSCDDCKLYSEFQKKNQKSYIIINDGKYLSLLWGVYHTYKIGARKFTYKHAEMIVKFNNEKHRMNLLIEEYKE
jgi:hypothetical protein